MRLCYQIFAIVSHPELVAEVDPPHVGMSDYVLRRAFHKHLAVMDNHGSVHDFQRGADVVIGYQHAEAAVAQVNHQIADVAQCYRIDARERLVQQQEMRLRG